MSVRPEFRCKLPTPSRISGRAPGTKKGFPAFFVTQNELLWQIQIKVKIHMSDVSVLTLNDVVARI